MSLQDIVTPSTIDASVFKARDLRLLDYVTHWLDDHQIVYCVGGEPIDAYARNLARQYTTIGIHIPYQALGRVMDAFGCTAHDDNPCSISIKRGRSHIEITSTRDPDYC